MNIISKWKMVNILDEKKKYHRIYLLPFNKLKTMKEYQQ
jgi:hypothetical protein